MMTITASMVKELRERTGAGMMECKKALVASNGDLEAAITAMRKSGQAKAAKRAGRIAAEGAILIANRTDNKSAYMIEVNSETDFVVRDKNFKAFANLLVQRGLETSKANAADLMASPVSDGESVTLEQARTELVAKIGENVQLRRVATESSTGIVGTYMHGERIGVLVSLDKDLPDLAKDIAMHIAATNPLAIDDSGVPQDVIDKERDIFSAQAKASGKPDVIIEKMVTGRITKFLKEICLLEQNFVKDDAQSVGAMLKSSDAKVLSFVRFEVGEGIEKQTVDFAEEVQAQLKDN
jgi:elongation factor Ts